MKPITIYLNLTKLKREWFIAKIDKEGNSNKYVSLVAWPNKQGPDQYGNTHALKQDVPKGHRETTNQRDLPFLGSLKVPAEEAAPPLPASASRPNSKPTEDDDVPF